MIELNKDQYFLAEPFVIKTNCDTVYPYSIIEKNQLGRIFVDNIECPNSVLFWHYCGFAFVVGNEKNGKFNQGLSKLLMGNFEDNQRRFILAVNDETWEKRIINLPKINLKCRKRFLFSFKKEKYQRQDFAAPDRYLITEISKELIDKLQGKVIPSFSWHAPEAFFNKGTGFCLIDIKNNEIASTAFSACIGNKKIDIGIETKPEYRGRGLGTIVAARMVQYILNIGYEPVWGCDTENLGSASVARKVGFEEVGSHSMYLR